MNICKKHDLKFIHDDAHMVRIRLGEKVSGKEVTVVAYFFQIVKMNMGLTYEDIPIKIYM